MVVKYDYEKAVAYAKKWALSRNPSYYDFSDAVLGGDCTNFISQCIFAGSSVMNFTKTLGWYYIDLNRRSPAWTGVQYLYNFLISNKGGGPFGHEIPLFDVMPGDIIQLSFDGEVMSHSLLVLEVDGQKDKENILIACHSYDALNKPLSEYSFLKSRAIHIDGVRR